MTESNTPPQRPPDHGREPHLVEGRKGTRRYSINALLERIIAQFRLEHGDDSAALLACETPTDYLRLLRDSIHYVLAVESIQLSGEQQADLTQRAYSELFAYGPLDDWLTNPEITTIALEGVNKFAVRYGHGELVSQTPIFEDQAQLQRVIQRLLKDANAHPEPDTLYLETGLSVGNRKISMNLVFPPASLYLTADIRLHPPQVPTLDTLTADARAQQLITAIAQSPHGFMVVGESESGKTTLLNIMATLAAHQQPERLQQIYSVERSGELRLPEGIRRRQVVWGGEHPLSFSAQITATLADTPHSLILDEVRADEAQAIAPLLAPELTTRQMWTFRAQAESKRLASALGILARLSDSTRGEDAVKTLYQRLPFVLVMRRRKNQLQVHSISQWQFNSGDYPDYVELMAQDWEGIAPTGKRPTLPLDLPDTLWD